MSKELIGKTLKEHYKILSLIAEGGMGAVYKAFDLNLQRSVAVKVMNPQYASQKDFQERFVQEARVAAKLNHSGIVQVYDFNQAGDPFYIVMEYISGPNLAQMLQDLRSQGTWIGQDEVIQIGKQVAAALGYAHRQGVFHRDIQPANIMMVKPAVEGQPYRVVLTDLGLAKLSQGGQAAQTNVAIGTPAYMSPEQTLGKPTDARSDIYSLGILLFELATARLPFPANNLDEATSYHTKAAPPSPRSIRSDISKGLEQVILKALEKDPAMRFQSMAELAEALDNCLAHIDQTVAAAHPLEDKISLITQQSQDQKTDRGASIFDEIGLPKDRSKNCIQVKTGNQAPFSIVVKAGDMTIGKAPDNDIVLADPYASHHHAKIEFNGQTYSIVDLDSTNGTFLNNAQLIPGHPQEWEADRQIRIGNSWLRLVPASPKPPPPKCTVEIRMDNKQISVEPGNSASLKITLFNQGSIVDQFDISVQGVNPSWVTFSATSLQLMDGAQGEIEITFSPPRNPNSRAGSYPFRIRATSKSYPEQECDEAKGTLIVGAYFKFSVVLDPEKIHSGKPAKAIINNEGGTQEIFTLRWKDPANELEFTPSQFNLQIAPGTQAIVAYQVQPRQQRIIGGEKSQPFTLAISENGLEPQLKNGELVSKGLIPPIILTILPVLVGLCLLLSVAARPLIQHSPTPTGTPSITETATPTTSYTPTQASPIPNTPTATQTFTPTPTNMPTSTATQTFTPTPIPTQTFTPISTDTPAPPPTPTPVPPSFAGTWINKSAQKDGDLVQLVIGSGNDFTLTATWNDQFGYPRTASQPGNFSNGKIVPDQFVFLYNGNLINSQLYLRNIRHNGSGTRNGLPFTQSIQVEVQFAVYNQTPSPNGFRIITLEPYTANTGP